jgi:hypothetical protein
MEFENVKRENVRIEDVKRENVTDARARFLFTSSRLHVSRFQVPAFQASAHEDWTHGPKH